MPDFDVDVVIAGGSVAGIATAAALREFGMTVMIVEPGQRTDRRLAGELIHPMGVDALRELGLLEGDAFAGATAIEGFAVFPDSGESKSRITLRYGGPGGSTNRAMALDYSVLRGNLEAAARTFDHVTFVDGARVTGIDASESDAPVVTIDTKGVRQTISCRMVVAADGASSPTRSLAGIGHTRRSISTIAGYVVDDASLPEPRFGHVIIGGSSVVLAYEIGQGRARVMFDQPVEQDEVGPVRHRERLLASIPAPFRRQVAAAMAHQKPLSFKSTEVVAHATSRGSVVLVGDAGGSCHPLTATGMTIGICDGLRLRDALRIHKGDLGRAFRHYDRVRRRAQRSRRMVASALHDVCSRRDPEMQVLRAGLIRYWRCDATSRSATMAILAMTDDRIASAFWQFLKVTRHGLVDYWARQRSARLRRLGLGARLVAALGALTIKQMTASLRAR